MRSKEEEWTHMAISNGSELVNWNRNEERLKIQWDKELQTMRSKLTMTNNLCDV